MFIDYHYVFYKRKARYKEEEKLFEMFGYIIQRSKEISLIIKGEMKLGYYEPR
jgi:hypothetical protein